VLAGVRRIDAALTRRGDRRRILVDGRTAVNYTMFAPVHEAMRGDRRLELMFTASEEPRRLAEIYAHAPAGTRVITPARAALMRFDAYVASDFMWATLPRGARRVQMFHGVGGKYGFDAPNESMRPWDRLFFVNERRLRNFIAAGAIEAHSAAITLVGMPKVDRLADGSLSQAAVLGSLELSPAIPTVLYAPTWSPASSLNLLGLDLIRRLLAMPVNLIVKLHDRSCDLRPQYSGGVDWPAAIASLLPRGRAALARQADVVPLLAAADIMITDHSSAGFEYLLLDRPLVRIHLPELIRHANIHVDYVALLEDAAWSTSDVASTACAVERALANPGERSASRRAVAQDLFYRPGTATMRAVAALYEAIELDAPDVAFAGEVSPCLP
jgi:CDP-glycerol glycerophosphotransferase (TagB/SpsB family)